jgi:outer membrane protein assembly factor BamB
MYRFNAFRQGTNQDSILSDASKVPALAIHAKFAPNDGGAFLGSPIVMNNRVFVGSTAGYFYALDATSLNLLWQYPAKGQAGLVGKCQNWEGGLRSSAAYFLGLVIFGAPDPTAESGLGSGRLFALKASGDGNGNASLVWKSDVLAHVSGCTPGNTNELHEWIANSSPLVMERTVYVGISDLGGGDDPTPFGRVMAVSLDTGQIVPTFSFVSINPPPLPTQRGGSVWDGPATDFGLSGVYVTTGNARQYQDENNQTQVLPQPAVNYGLSMLKLDRNTGGVIWQFQPLPYNLDNDPDWNAGVTIMHTSCGMLAASVMKDGWTYALDTTLGSCRWQFPPTAELPGCKFSPQDNHYHGFSGYRGPGAAWGDVLVIRTGGEAIAYDTVNDSGPTAGYNQLHALNACANSEASRVRWIANVPNSSGGEYALGAPTVAGGIVYVTTDQGHLVVFGDPSIVSPAGYICSEKDFQLSQCATAGYSIVPVPTKLADVSLDGSSAAGMRSEPVIAGGRLYVATGGGTVYMLSP